jgi:hypothetical protein
MLFVPPPAESPSDRDNVVIVPEPDLIHRSNAVADDALYMLDDDVFQFAQFHPIPSYHPSAQTK